MSTYDAYAEAREIAKRIDLEGFSDHAEKIRNAIDHGQSGTEIFMQLRFYLTQLQDNIGIDPATLDRINTLVGKINVALAR